MSKQTTDSALARPRTNGKEAALFGAADQKQKIIFINMVMQGKTIEEK
ncbi:MAG: hypothetical protein ABIG64_05205 [Candidatus Omnitrophota bacterium]